MSATSGPLPRTWASDDGVSHGVDWQIPAGLPSAPVWPFSRNSPFRRSLTITFSSTR